MKSNFAKWLAAALVAAAVDARAQSGASYDVTALASLGGTASGGNSIDDLGVVAGVSNLAGDSVQHAAVWLAGDLFDLGTLGGPNSGVLWPVKNARGLISGIAETGRDDPNGERWSCSAFFPALTGKTCLGVAWEFGVARALPTLGGNNGFATGSNGARQIAGWAETAAADASCVAPQKLGFLPVVWGPGASEVRALPLLAGDSAGAATALNDRGQVVGISGSCDRAVGRFTARGMVLWENGVARELPGLGGVAWNTPMAINERGDVVGFANTSAAAGGSFRAHAFLWTREGGTRDLGVLPGDSLSEALGINAFRQIVGVSCTAGFASCRAVLWEGGRAIDLSNAAPGVGLLVAAGDIDDLGRITGQVALPSGSLTAFLAVPRARGDGSDDSRADARAGAPELREEARRALLQRLRPGGAGEADR